MAILDTRNENIDMHLFIFFFHFQSGTAVGKLLTLGGVGIWWIVDVILLVRGMLLPEDGSNWVPNY